MSMQDPISSLLTGIRNAQSRKKSEVTVPSSVKKIALLELLVREGYIDSIRTGKGKKPEVSIFLKYSTWTKPQIEAAIEQ